MPTTDTTSPDSKVRVIVVEDDPIQRSALVGYFGQAGFVVTGVGSVLEFYQALAKDSFSLAVVDLKLPDHCGLELVDYLRKNSSMGVIVVSAQDDDAERVKGYQAGADLYLVKPVNFAELVSAAKNLVRRLGVRATSVLRKGLEPWQLIETSWQLVTPAGQAIKLTAKEFQFVKCLAETPSEMVSRHLMLERLAYTDDEYALRAMDSLVRRLRTKITDVWEQGAPIKTIRNGGYCFTLPIIITNLFIP